MCRARVQLIPLLNKSSFGSLLYSSTSVVVVVDQRAYLSRFFSPPSCSSSLHGDSFFLLRVSAVLRVAERIE